jgi:hypothetical protein
MDLNTLATYDKTLHFTYGALTAQPFTALARRYAPGSEVLVGLTVGAVVGVGKEMYDCLIRKQRFSSEDVVATMLGGLYTGVLA